MKTLFSSFLLLVSYTLFAQNNTMYDANAQQRKLNAGFTGIVVGDGIDLFLTQGNEESIAVSASDEKYMEHFKTEVENGILKIYYNDNVIKWRSNNKRQLTAYVSFKNLNTLHASGGAEVIAKNNLTLTDMNMEFSSGSLFKGQINADNLNVSQSSGSNIIATGKAAKLKIATSSGAMFKGFDLVADICEAKTNSGAGIRISINKELDAKASSGGSIQYKGDGVITNIKASSGGMIKKVND